MTTQQRQLIRETFPILAEMAGPLSQLFYGRLFQIAPAARSMFRGDIRAQGRKLMDMLTVLVEDLEEPGKHQTSLRAMGQRHAGYGVKPEDYEVVRVAFGWAVAQALQLESNSAVKGAWMALVEEIGKGMKTGAAELPPSPKSPE